MAHVWLRFVHENGITSRAIEWFTRSEFCHVDFVLSNGKFLGARLEGGVEIRDHDYLTPDSFCYAKVEVMGSNRRVLGWATSQVGKPYDWVAILAFLPRTNWHDPGKWFCSELVAEAFKLKDSAIVDNRAYRITPQMVYESVRVEKLGMNVIPQWIRDPDPHFDN